MRFAVGLLIASSRHAHRHVKITSTTSPRTISQALNDLNPYRQIHVTRFYRFIATNIKDTTTTASIPFSISTRHSFDSSQSLTCQQDINIPKISNSRRYRKRARASHKNTMGSNDGIPQNHDNNIGSSSSKGSSNGVASEILGVTGTWSNSSITDNVPKMVDPQHYMEISVMTLNILAQRYIECHRALYRNCVDPIHTEWNFRKKLLKQMFNDYIADIVCLQEVEAAHYTDTLEPHFKSLGYNGILSIKSDEITEGCAMFYNPRRLKLKSVHQLHMYRPDLCQRLNRNNVAILGTFEGTEPHEVGTTRFHVATTHLLFNPNRGETKLAQVRYLMSQLEFISRQTVAKENGSNVIVTGDRSGSQSSTALVSSAKHQPIILCGDFNMEPESPLAHFVMSGAINTFDVKAGDISGQKESRGHGHVITPSDLYFRNMDREGYVDHLNSGVSNGWTASQAGSRSTSTSNTASTSNSSSDRDDYVVRQPLPLRSAYRTHSKHGERFVSTHHTLASAMVDYVFYHSCAERLQLVKRKSLLTESQMREQGCLPNSRYGSDHMPLWTKFRLAH